MANTSENRLVEISTSWSGRRYTLYVRAGKPVRISHHNEYGDSQFYNNNAEFNSECERIVYHLSIQHDANSLKKLYDSLYECSLKEYVGERINVLIDFYEKALANLKS